MGRSFFSKTLEVLFQLATVCQPSVSGLQAIAGLSGSQSGHGDLPERGRNVPVASTTAFWFTGMELEKVGFTSACYSLLGVSRGELAATIESTALEPAGRF